MESASYAIDNDNDFYLGHLPTLDMLLETGLTVFVDKIFPKYHDMTLIQYAIAKRKPKTLTLMLERLDKKDIAEKDRLERLRNIMYPKTSNTRGSLLNLAVEFGSKGNTYEDDDNRCLEIIINHFKDYIKSDTKSIEAPLVQSIRCKNNGAIKSLIGAEADFFYPLKTDENVITDTSKLSEMPIMTIFRLNNNKEQLKEMFDGILKDQKEKILQRAIYLLKVNNDSFLDYLGDNNLHEVKDFLSEEKKNVIDPLHPIDDNDDDDDDPNSKQKQKQKETPKREQNSSENKCPGCGEVITEVHHCGICRKDYCQNCINNHEHTP